MTDLHCHILPNIDDGAKDVSISLRLLEKEYAEVCEHCFYEPLQQ